MFEKELAYFIREQVQLVGRYEGKTLALKDDEVVGVYDTLLGAYLAIKQGGQLGKVMLQVCSKGPEAYTVSAFTQSSSYQRLAGSRRKFPSFGNCKPHASGGYYGRME